jgi:hypothetical protein
MAVGKRTLALVFTPPFGKPLAPRHERMPALRHMLSGSPARCRKLAGFVPHFVTLIRPTLPLYRGLMLMELILTLGKPAP